ncbi:MAG: DUF2163 domain-containing protein [Neisseria sp.]|nr:DUF2163 domain-containing protein [Neisseria sp.]
MKQANRELIELLHGSETFVMADLYTLKLNSGKLLRYTDADMPVIWQGERFEAHSVIIKRGATRLTRDLEADGNELEIAALPEHTLEGLPFAEAVLGGVLDGATVKIERVFFRDFSDGAFQTAVGAVILFAGRVSDVSGSRSTVRVSVKSDLELLNVASPRNVYQAGCMRTLYSPGCGVNRAAFTVNGRVTANSANSNELLFRSDKPDGYYDQGVVEFTSGKNAGLTRTVKSHAQGRLNFALRLPHPPKAGDAFKIVPGCSKTMASCKDKFNNIVHFRGFPFIPHADTVV